MRTVQDTSLSWHFSQFIGARVLVDTDIRTRPADAYPPDVLAHRHDVTIVFLTYLEICPQTLGNSREGFVVTGHEQIVSVETDNSDYPFINEGLAATDSQAVSWLSPGFPTQEDRDVGR